MQEELSAIPASALSIPGVLRALGEASPPGGRVLSVYLDISPDRSAGRAYLLAYRARIKGLRALLPVGEHGRFEAAAEQVERYLAEQLVPHHPGVAVFASGEPSYFFAVPVPTRPFDTVQWGERPVLEPLEALLDDYERVAVLLFDKERARLFSVYLGAIEERRTIVDEVPGKQATGGWFALSQTRYARHHEDHLLRHAKRAIAALLEMLRARPFDRLLVGGPDEALALLRHQLPRPLRARVAGTVALELFASDAAVLETTLRTAAAIERNAEVVAVTELVDAASTRLAALGLTSTLAALNEGRVHRLFVADDFAAAGGHCPTCGRLTKGVDRCGDCDAKPTSIPDLRESIIEAARQQGARVEVVSGEASELLRVHAGLGAWTRY